MSSDADRFAFAREEMISHLVEAERWDRVLELGPEILGSEPENGYVHSMMALSALMTDDFERAKRHVDATMQLAPESAFSHLLQARYFRKRGRILYSKNSLVEALRLEPENSSIWCEYGWNCLHRGDVRSAREACDQARSLAPNSIELESLAIAIGGASEDADRISVYEQIEQMQASLRFDPENESVMFNIGLIYLEELDDGRSALHWFRQAAAIDPQDEQIRDAILKAARRCDPVLSVINFPWNILRRIGNYSSEFWAKRPVLSCLLAPILIIPATLMMVVFSLWAVFLFVPGKLYGWMTTAETLGKIAHSPVPFGGIYRIPLWIRLCLCVVVNLVFLAAVWTFLTHPAARNYHDLVIGGGMIIAMIVGIWISAVKKG